MKTIIKSLIYCFILIFASCEHSNNMLTVINTDGSCYREYSAYVSTDFLKGDSAKKSTPFIVDIDSSYNIKWKYKNSDWQTKFPVSQSEIDSIILTKNKNTNIHESTDFEAIATKKYTSVEEMARNFSLSKSHEWNDLKVKYKFEKKFRWFYTFYKYQEIYPKIETDFTVPISKYLTKDEELFWFTGKPEILKGMNGVEIREYVGKIEDLYNRWFSQNIWNNEYKVLLENYSMISKPPVTIDRLKELRDTIFLKEASDNQDFKMQLILNKYFKTKVFSELWDKQNSPLGEFENNFLDQKFVKYFAQNINYKLLLPGKNIQANTDIMQGDTLIWNLTAYRMFPQDYTIEAESRKANIWAFVLSFLLIILAVGSFFYKPKQK